MVNKISDFIGKVINWYGELNGIRKLGVTVAAVIIIAILATGISKINFDEKIINYKDLYYDNIVSLDVNEDKDVYIKCDSSIKRLILTYFGNYNIGNKNIDLDDFYEFSKNEEYKISKSKFNKLIGNIVTELQSERNASLNNMETFYPIVKNIYTYSSENKMYLVEFSTEQKHILGLQFKEGRFYIFYVE